ncbi:hypothetical protein BV25DRAFT_1843684 [Artomyces pyxidatus]|uniref:Uncharacterized protein n=1 Tax=Artomyces pyxidatus TaxID=48021 RepID=A0ACB8SD70_9AGAM|nr:hypothetical protein BV25DRAFT_1843684 [Artomyces pyxidatus]
MYSNSTRVFDDTPTHALDRTASVTPISVVEGASGSSFRVEDDSSERHFVGHERAGTPIQSGIKGVSEALRYTEEGTLPISQQLKREERNELLADASWAMKKPRHDFNCPECTMQVWFNEVKLMDHMCSRHVHAIEITDASQKALRILPDDCFLAGFLDLIRAQSAKMSDSSTHNDGRITQLDGDPKVRPMRSTVKIASSAKITDEMNWDEQKLRDRTPAGCFTYSREGTSTLHMQRNESTLYVESEEVGVVSGHSMTNTVNRRRFSFHSHPGRIREEGLVIRENRRFAQRLRQEAPKTGTADRPTFKTASTHRQGNELEWAHHVDVLAYGGIGTGREANASEQKEATSSKPSVSHDDHAQGRSQHTVPPRQSETSTLPTRQIRLIRFSQDAPQGSTGWFKASGPFVCTKPPDGLKGIQPSDLYLHYNTATNLTSIWLFSDKHDWVSVEVGHRHPEFKGRYLYICKLGKPNWVTSRSFSTMNSRARREMVDQV